MPRIDDLYSALNQQGLYTKSLDEFKNQFSTPEAIRQLHFALEQEKLYTKPLADFETQFFGGQVKKKEEALPSLSLEDGGLLGTSTMAQDQQLVSSGEGQLYDLGPIYQQYQAQKPKTQEYISFEQKPTTPFLPEKEKGLFGEDLPEKATVEKPYVFRAPDELDRYIDKFPTEIVDFDEGDAVSKLSYLYGDLGFKFDEAIPGVDAVQVTAPDGTTKTFSWDSFTKGGDEETAAEFKSFIKQKVRVESNLDKVNKFYTGEIDKIVKKEDVDARIKSLSSQQDEINTFIKGYNVEVKQIQDELIRLMNVPDASRDANYQQELLDAQNKYSDLEARRRGYESKLFLIDQDRQKLNKTIGEYIENQEELGSFARAMGHGYLSGYGAIIAGGTGMFADLFVMPFLDARDATDAKDRFTAAAKKLGYGDITEQEALAKYGQQKVEDIYDKATDEYRKQIKYGMGTLEMAREIPLKVFGTDNISEEYVSKFQEGFLGGSLYGLAKTIPAITTGPMGMASALFFAAQGYDAATQIMENDPDLSQISESEKLAVKAPISIVVGLLEKYGLRNAIAQKGLLNNLISKSLGKVAATGATKSFSRFVKEDIENRITRGLLTAGGAAFAEFETGALQELSESAIKETYNYIKGKEMFKDLPNSAYEYLKETMYAGAQEAVGGFVMGVPGAVASAYRKQAFEGMSDQEFLMFEFTALSPEIESGFVAKLKQDVNSGELSPAEAKEKLNEYRSAKSLYGQIPSDLTIENKKKAMNLLKKRNELSLSIQGKDPSLVKSQQAKISEINNQLEELSKPENNAVQKQTTSKVPVQPEARVGEEMAQGAPETKPEVVTEKGKEEVVSEIDAVTTTDKAVVPAGKRLFNEPNPETAEISKSYKEKEGISTPEGSRIEQLDTNRSMQIADAYEAMEDAPNDPMVQEAYAKLAEETKKQYDAIKAAGYEVEVWEGEGEPYQNAQEMIDDVRNNKHMYIFSTEKGFGDTPITDQQRQQNAMLQDSGAVDKNGNKLLYNDMFRFVHDFFGHSERGNGFGAIGEENAWDVHARMYSPLARRAMTTETRGQNSWVNFGPQMRGKDGKIIKKGDPGYLSPQERAFAPQKMGLLPEEFSQIEETATVSQDTINESIDASSAALGVAFPEVEFIVGDNLEDTKARIVEALTPRYGAEKAQAVADGFKDARGQTLFAGNKPIAVVINKEAANNRTAGHEAWEIMLNDAFGKNPEKFAEFRKAIDDRLRELGYDDIADSLVRFSNEYADQGTEAMFREYMAEFGGMLVEGGLDPKNLTQQEKTLLDKIKDIINKFALELTGKEVFLKDATAENIIDFMVTISEKVSKGETVEQFFEGKDTTDIADTNTIFTNKSQKIGNFDIQYFEDDAEFQRLIDSGAVVQNVSIDEAAGKPVAVHQPDNLFVGNLNYKDKKIMDGFGGIYYVLKFGNVWASGAKNSAQSLANLINKSRKESSDGKGRLILVRGTQDKMISSVQGVKASMQILEELVFDGLISTSDFRKALTAAGKKYNINFSGNSSAASIKKDIEDKFMNVSDSTFARRGDFFSDLITELGKLDSPNKNIEEIRKALGATKRIGFSKQGIRDQIGTVLTERLLLGLPSSHAYAIIEVAEDVKVIKDDKHPSYPFPIVTKSGKPPVLKVLGYRPKATEAIRRLDGSPASNAQLGLSQRGMGIGRITEAGKKEEVITARAQKINYKDLPGYDRMRKELDGIIKKGIEKGNSKAQILEGMLGYLQAQSKVYEIANDSQREQMVRDIKKELGERIKSAPRVQRILGIDPEKKILITNTEMIKSANKAAKDAVTFMNSIRAKISAELKQMEKSGAMSAKQVQAIINKLNKVNLEKDQAVKDFVDYMQKVYKDAEYADKLSKSNDLAKRIKKLSKSDSVPAGTKAVAKQFAKIEPRRTENIDEYLENATALYEAMRPTAARVTQEGVDIAFKKAVDYDKLQDYSKSELEKQEKQKASELLARNKDLVMAGILTEDMTLDEIKKLLDAIKEDDDTTLPSEEKEKMIRDAVKKVFGYYRSIALSMIQRGVDPFTGEEVELTDAQKRIGRRFLEVNTDVLSLKDAYRAVESLENFIVNKSTDGMSATLADYVGTINAKNLAKEGYKGKKLRLFYSKKLGRAWAEQIEQLDLMVQRMFGGVNRAMAFMRASGANEFKVGKTTAQLELNRILNKYANKFGKIPGFNSLENVMERGVLAFLSRTVNENTTQQQNEFERRKKLVEETLEYMKNGTEKEQKQAVELQKVYDKIVKGSSTLDQVKSKASKTNKEAVDFWISEWSDRYDNLQELSRNVYNVVLGSDIDYTPDRLRSVSGRRESEAQWGESSFATNSDYFDTKEAGVLMENKRIKTLGKRPSRIVSFDFDVNMSNAMYDALIDINTAEATRQMKSFFESPSFDKIMASKDDADVLKDRMKKYVIRSKRKDYVTQDQLSGMFKALNTIASLGAGRALGGILQVPKQTIGVAFNTMINSGGRLSIIDTIKAKEFIDKSGYGIALRGVASNADIQSINKILEKASKTSGEEALRLIQKANEMWLDLFLVKPDVWIARTSWMSYYKQRLDKMGYDTSNIEWDTHKLNKEAADYAQAMVDRQQNYSDSDLAGEFLASKQPLVMFLRKTFFPFMTFIMNQKSRMYVDLSIIGNPASSTEEKLNAAKSLSGMSIEMATYAGMSMFFSNMIQEITNYLWGYEEDEEEKKKRMLGSAKYYAKGIVTDILSPIPATNESVRIAFNAMLEKLGVPKDEFELPGDFDPPKNLLGLIGMNAIIAQKLSASYDKIQMAHNGKFIGKDFAKNDVEMIMDLESQRKMAYVAAVDFAYAMGFLPTEFGQIANKATKKAQKNAIPVPQEKEEKTQEERSDEYIRRRERALEKRELKQRIMEERGL